MASIVQKEYQLSFEILGHSADVRAVRSFQVEGHAREHILTASRDGTACVWAPEHGSPNEYVLRKILRKHSGYVSALCVIPKDLAAGRSAPLVVTGGQDKTLLVHSLEEGIDEPLETYVGHTELVTCIIFQHNQLISTSWDSTIRVWTGERQCDKLEAHKPAVWTVAGLFEFDGTRRALSGGADRAVRLWELDSKVCVQEYRGHADVVRDVKVIDRESFLSAANDCTIRKWNIHTGQCVRELYGHQAYVYSLSIFSHGAEQFASCGEDGSLRVWEGEDCQQVIHHPAASVWVVWCMENGDIITGSSDGVARVFSASQERRTSAEHQASYDSRVQDHKSSSGSDIDVKNLPGMEALATPGKKEGQTLMINKDGVPEVYQWSEDAEQWIKIGDAIGQAPQSSSTYQGQEYDHVFDIELDEGSPTMRKLKLPYNKSTDPYIAAEEFLEANNLPITYLDQVAEFIVQNAGEYTGPASSSAFTDPFTGGARYVPESSSSRRTTGQGGADPFTGGSRYVPGGGGGGPAVGTDTPGFSSGGGGADPFTGGSSYRPESAQPQVQITFKGLSDTFFPMSSFRTFTSPEDYGGKVVGKIREFNAAIGQAQALTGEQLTRLEGLSKVLTAPTHASAAVQTPDLQVIEAILRWPPEYVFPGLDLLRLALLNDSGNQYFIRDDDSVKMFLGDLLAFAIGSQAQSKNQLLVLRSLANLFSKDSGAELMHSERIWVLSQLDALLSTGNKPNQIALATVLQNYCHHYSLTKAEDGIKDCLARAVKVLASSFDNEAKFRVLVGVGSLACVDKTLVTSSALPSDLVSLIQPICSVVDPAKLSQCAQSVLQALR